MGLEDDQLLLDTEAGEVHTRRRVKGFVEMGRLSEERPFHKVKLHEDPFYDDLPLNELDNDVLKSLASVKPGTGSASVPDFNRYDKTKNE